VLRQSMVEARMGIAALLRGRRKVTLKRIYSEDGKLRFTPENGDYEGLVLLAEDVRVQGRVVYVIHPPRKKAAGGGA
jgi:repressor LexA